VSRELPKKRCVSLAVSQTLPLPFTREPSYGLSVFGIERLKCEVCSDSFTAYLRILPSPSSRPPLSKDFPSRKHLNLLRLKLWNGATRFADHTRASLSSFSPARPRTAAVPFGMQVVRRWRLSCSLSRSRSRQPPALVREGRLFFFLRPDIRYLLMALGTAQR
jgi:hypothetical protein